ncbi:phosphorylase family protein [Actinomadura fibrosa]|uniref:Nucleoside phosphorylase domain-containing protein n=1 Tax=Actinomadura fibrosa TaxID=111802 RepID=A0ABW2XLE8_9ACTN|nr:1-hydroxy-2-methyl-2-butenyl 4-diphosphate reductase [Actinomadura fibrosa]
MTSDDAGGRRPILGPVVCAGLRMEARAVRRGLSRVPVVVVGYRARRADRLPAACAGFVLVGFGGALDERLRPGDVVVADEIRGGGPPVACGGAHALARELIRDGLNVQVGPLVTTDHVVSGAERAVWAAQGARVADMESAVIAARAGGRPVAAVRVVVDGPGHPLLHPGMVSRGLGARRVLARTGPALERWSAFLLSSGSRPDETADGDGSGDAGTAVDADGSEGTEVRTP